MRNREDLGQLDTDWDALSASELQAAGRPPLARLAYNRLGFGPRPDSVNFGDDWNAFVAYVDQQLAYESINDNACDFFVNLMKRTDNAGLQVPPLTADINTIEQYRTAYSDIMGYGPDYQMYIYLINTTIARALLSRRQLLQVMADFWTNHFNTLGRHPCLSGECAGQFSHASGHGCQKPGDVGISQQYLERWQQPQRKLCPRVDGVAHHGQPQPHSGASLAR